jgi:hypothetical protein
MNPAILLQAVLTYGPEILPLIQQLAAWAKSGKQDVTPEDIAQLIAYGKKSAADYLAEAQASNLAPTK